MIVSNCFLFFCSLVRPALPPWGLLVALFPSPHFHSGEGEGRIFEAGEGFQGFGTIPAVLGVNSSSSSARACISARGDAGISPAPVVGGSEDN